MNRIKNFIILVILIIFLCLVLFLPVTCIFKSVTGILCPACGMTRAFISIIHFDFLNALKFNLLSIPSFLFFIYFFVRLFVDLIKNKFNFIPKLLTFFQEYYWLFLLLLFISFIFNNAVYIKTN